MNTGKQIPGWKDKILFTPGPLTTSRTVKQALLRDLGSRDIEFIGLVKDIRHELVKLGQVSPDEYTAVLMQGSGTFGLEAVVSSTVPPDGKLLVVITEGFRVTIRKADGSFRPPVVGACMAGHTGNLHRAVHVHDQCGDRFTAGIGTETA